MAYCFFIETDWDKVLPKLLKIVLCSASFLWASCAIANSADLAGSEWGFDKPVEQFMKFSGKGQVSGHAGCNRFFGSFSIEKHKSRINIGPLASTKKACGQSVMKAESSFLKKLETTQTYKRNARSLDLFDESGALLLSLAWRDFD